MQFSHLKLNVAVAYVFVWSWRCFESDWRYWKWWRNSLLHVALSNFYFSHSLPQLRLWEWFRLFSHPVSIHSHLYASSSITSNKILVIRANVQRAISKSFYFKTIDLVGTVAIQENWHSFVMAFDFDRPTVNVPIYKTQNGNGINGKPCAMSVVCHCEIFWRQKYEVWSQNC